MIILSRRQAAAWIAAAGIAGFVVAGIPAQCRLSPDASLIRLSAQFVALAKTTKPTCSAPGLRRLRQVAGALAGQMPPVTTEGASAVGWASIAALAVVAACGPGAA